MYINMFVNMDVKVDVTTEAKRDVNKNMNVNMNLKMDVKMVGQMDVTSALVLGTYDGKSFWFKGFCYTAVMTYFVHFYELLLNCSLTVY